MPDRAALIADFVRRAGWADADRRPLAGDASNRRYLRLVRPSAATAVLMDADPARGEDVRPFVAIARHLAGLGLSAPAMLAEDAANGLLLLEDLGDALFARLVAADPALERPLYEAAAELLATLHLAPPPPGLDRFTPARMADLDRIAFDWYAHGAPGSHAGEALARLEAVLASVAPEPTVLSLRDFHAENLIWLPDRQGAARVGLLDFQDAVVAHPAYDLVSLLDDARRDVGATARETATRRFLDLTGHDAGAFAAASAALSVQRNLRILGVFARLSRRDGKTGYLRLLPRVWGHLVRALSQPALDAVRAPLLAVLPPPDPATLARLETPCATPVP